MSRVAYPPDGSSIRVADETSVLALSWPPRKAGKGRFGLSAFLLFWLAGWAFGEVTVARHLFSGSDSGNVAGSSTFMLAWLGAWTVGGIMAIATLWRLLRPGTESVLQLSPETLAYREGRGPVELPFSVFSGSDQLKMWKTLWRKPTSAEIPRASVRNLKLERIEGTLRLTVDQGADRITIGADLGEPELEWLHGVLRDWIPERGSPREPALP